MSFAAAQPYSDQVSTTADTLADEVFTEGGWLIDQFCRG
jgi:hypothetical protein